MTASNHAYFNLMDYIRNIKSVDVAAQMAQSVAFSVDVAINGACRQLMKQLRELRDRYGIESVSDMTLALEDTAFAEEVMMEAGKDDLGPVATILQLNCVRDAWHELASELTGMTFNWQGVPRTYEIKPIEEMLLREVKLQVKPVVAHRLRVQVERRAGDASKEDIDAVYAKRLAREEQRARDTARALTEQQGTIVTLYQVASNPRGDLRAKVLGETDKYSEHEEVHFHELDASLRRTFIEAALKGAARAEEYATSSTSITDTEFDAVSFAVIAIERELKAILNGPAYAVQRAMTTV